MSQFLNFNSDVRPLSARLLECFFRFHYPSSSFLISETWIYGDQENDGILEG